MNLIPERDGLDRYLEDTETVDWQTPAVLEKARELCFDVADPGDTIRVLWRFARQDVPEPAGGEDDKVACSASQVLREGSGVEHARANLLVALLRSRGIPAGFAYQKLRRGGKGPLFVLAGFACVYLHAEERWAPLDLRPADGPLPELEEASLTLEADPDLEEVTFDLVFARPHRAVTDVLSRAPNLDHVRRFLPDSL